MRSWFYLCPLQHFERNLFTLQGAAASKLKGNFYFLNSLHAQSNKQTHILVMNSICSRQKLDESYPLQHLCPGNK